MWLISDLDLGQMWLRRVVLVTGSYIMASTINVLN